MNNTEAMPLAENGRGQKELLPKFGLSDFFIYLFCFLFTYGLFHSILENLEPNIYTTASYLGIFFLATVLIAARQKRFAMKALMPGLACMAISFSFLLHSDSELHIVLFMLLIPLSGLYCLALTSANAHSFGSFYVLLDLLRTELLLPFKHLPAPFIAAANSLKHRRAERKETKRKRTWIPIVVGLLAAVPILLLVIPLLLDSDAAFESVAGSFFRSLQSLWNELAAFFNERFSVNGFALYLAAFFSVYIFSVMFLFANGIANSERKDTSAKYRNLQKAPVPFFITVLGAVCAVYVVYLLSQSAYFFSAFSGHLPSGVSISITEYARRGFFEMVKIAGVNFLLFSASIGFCKRKENKIASPVRWLNVFLCVFTILLCVISVCKILMYIRSFGLTQKRLYVLTADIALIFCFAAVLLRLFKEVFPYMKVIFSAFFLSAAVLGLIGVNNTVARYNTNGLLAGSLPAYNVSDLPQDCGDAALPYLQKIADGESEYAKQAKTILKTCYGDYQYEPEAPVFHNIEQYRAARYAESERQKATGFRIEICLDIERPVYALGYSCETNGKTVLGGGVEHADKTQLGYETIDISLLDLPENIDLSSFDMQFWVYLSPDDDAEGIPVENLRKPLLEEAKPGCIYQLILRETFDGGYEVE